MTFCRRSKLLAVLIFITVLFFIKIPIFAGPVSPHFELKNYGFGSGGIENASSSSYSMLGIVGDQSGTQSASNTYKIGTGLIFTNQASLPSAPSFTNPSSNYDRLKLILDNGDNATDAAFAVAITNNNWTTTRYIQNDFTIGDTLENEDWMTYDNWGDTNGKFITGLSENTIYRVKAKARQGGYTETEWSAEASATTGVPTLTFGISADTVSFDQLNGENSWTDSTKSTTLTTSTNAYYGYTVYGHETTPLTNIYNNTISDYIAPNSNPTNWNGIGFGYSTNDNNLIGGLANRFTSSGPKYAGFTTSAPGDPVADHHEYVVENPILNEQFTVSYRVTVNANQTAGLYRTNIVYVVVPEY
jgi:hypothetical protein